MSISFPTNTDVSKLLGSLLGDAVPLNTHGAPPPADASFTAVCLDDEGQPVGAICADLRAAAYLAGKLLMMPVDPLIESATSEGLPESAVDALSEVFNNLTICINDVEGNPHVRSLRAVPTTDAVADQEWLGSASSRMDFGGSFANANATLSFVSK